MKSIDLNGDVGELEGSEGLASDGQLMPFLSSANIACGGHAGSEDRIRQTIDLAMEHKVAIGAHPGYEDRQNFGRLPVSLARSQIADLIERQVGLVLKHVTGKRARMTHVKPHGALYNLAARDNEAALGILDGMKRLDRPYYVVGLANSRLTTLAHEHGVPCLHEFFGDRNYRMDGSLVSRQESGAIVEDSSEIVDRVLRLLRTGEVRALTGQLLRIRADTICLHGDSPHAAMHARRLHAELLAAGIPICPPPIHVESKKG